MPCSQHVPRRQQTVLRHLKLCHVLLWRYSSFHEMPQHGFVYALEILLPRANLHMVQPIIVLWFANTHHLHPIQLDDRNWHHLPPVIPQCGHPKLHTNQPKPATLSGWWNLLDACSDWLVDVLGIVPKRYLYESIHFVLFRRYFLVVGSCTYCSLGNKKHSSGLSFLPLFGSRYCLGGSPLAFSRRLALRCLNLLF